MFVRGYSQKPVVVIYNIQTEYEVRIQGNIGAFLQSWVKIILNRQVRKSNNYELKLMLVFWILYFTINILLYIIILQKNSIGR